MSAIDRNQVSGSTLLSYQNGFLTYSKDGISYTDYKGNAMWNQTYDMQSPCVSVRSGWVAVGDYNGNLIYDISQDGTSKQIDTNLPVKSLSVAANGVVAAILEDGDVTWINVYNPTGEKSSRNQNDDAEIGLSGFRVIVGQWKTDDGGISESRKRQYEIDRQLLQF